MSMPMMMMGKLPGAARRIGERARGAKPAMGPKMDFLKTKVDTMRKAKPNMKKTMPSKKASMTSY